jgi:hypothetical protein
MDLTGTEDKKYQLHKVHLPGQYIKMKNNSNKFGKSYSKEYTNIPKAFFMPHDFGHS